MRIRTECYLVALDKYREEYPDAHFEVITRSAGHVLSPSWTLVTRGRGGLPFEIYERLLLAEFRSNRREVEGELQRIREIARSGREVFLVCFEKDASHCHRSIVKRLVEDQLSLEREEDRPVPDKGEWGF
jgi:hypothetical protein